jgi:hypothetical protein
MAYRYSEKRSSHEGTTSIPIRDAMIIAIAIGSLISTTPPQIAEANEPNPPSVSPDKLIPIPRAEYVVPKSFDELRNLLVTSREETLLMLLLQFDTVTDALKLTTAQLEEILPQLKKIEKHDEYQKAYWSKRRHTAKYARYRPANRIAATNAIVVLGFRRIANELRSLPLSERVNKLLEYFEGRATVEIGQSDAPRWFGGELWRMGKDAVPFILARAENAPDHQKAYMKLLSRIADARAIDFLISRLRAIPEDNLTDKCNAISLLARFKDAKVIEVLIAELNESQVRLPRGIRPQQQCSLRKQARPSWTYPIRKSASRTLSGITKKHWSPVFQEDPKTWKAWWKAADREAFDPSSIARTDSDLSELLESFFYLFAEENMRSPSWNDGNGHQWAFNLCAKDLVRLGPRVPETLVETYKRIDKEFPVWGYELQVWTLRLLETMDTPASHTAARDIGL